MPSDDRLSEVLHEWLKGFMRRSMQSFIVFTKEAGISPTQVAAMGRIEHEGAAGVSDIGEGLGISSAAASQMLERLVQLGYILRTEDPHDRRVKQIALTDKGREMLRNSMRAREGWMSELSATLTPEEREAVIKGLTILTEKIKQFEKKGVNE